ncbi:hypothetical protein BH23ACT9_BH23ACT9_10640 [soil metagenome]
MQRGQVGTGQRGRGLRWRRDDGSIMPVFVALTWVTVMMGVLFFQTGRATDLGAEAQTGSDAAALAAAEDIHNQILEWLMSGAHTPFAVNRPRAVAAANDYAQRNQVGIREIRIEESGFYSFDVFARATTNRRLTPLGYVSEDSVTGERREFTVGSGEQGDQTATARVSPGAGGFFATSAGVSGGGAATGSAGSCPVGESELAALAAAAGVPIDFARTSALARYSDCDGGRAVQPMEDRMKVSVLRLEHAMGQPLNLNSAYRSPEYQRELCRRVRGPCAPPGVSMHNAGLAIDVQNWQAAAAAVSRDPEIGLCQPLPVNDAVHFSHVTGRECGGRTGASNGGVPGGNPSPVPFGGFAQLSAQAGLTVGLIR